MDDIIYSVQTPHEKIKVKFYAYMNVLCAFLVYFEDNRAGAPYIFENFSQAKIMFMGMFGVNESEMIEERNQK